MRRMFVAAVLCAALLAGCGAAPGDTMNPPASQSTTQSEAAPETTPVPTEAPAQTDTTEEQRAVLDAFVSYGSDTAGGSLKNAQAAAVLVEYLSHSTIDADTAAAWRADLDEEKQQMLYLNWDGILSSARQICSDPADEKGFLVTAGVTTDFRALDLSAVPDKLEALDRVLGADTIAVIE